MGVEFIGVKATLLQAGDKVTFEPNMWFLLDREKPEELARRGWEPDIEEDKQKHPLSARTPYGSSIIQERAIGFSFSFVHSLMLGIDRDEPLGGIEYEVEQTNFAESPIGQDIAYLAEMVQAFLDYQPTQNRDGKEQPNNTVSFLTAWEWNCWRCGTFEYPDEWDCGGSLLGWMNIIPAGDNGALSIVAPEHLKEYLQAKQEVTKAKR